MEILTPKEMQEVDKRAIEHYKIPSILLMEHAAYQVFLFLKEQNITGKMMIVCGPGNNGGDGLALARQLSSWTNHKIKVLMASTPDKLTADGKVYYQICQKIGIDVEPILEDNKREVFNEIQEADVVIDALFGTGLTRPIQGLFREIIESINSSLGKIISVDIPSGIDGLTGQVKGICVKANDTITFVRPKLGLYLYPGFLYTGEVRVVNIGILDSVIQDTKVEVFSIEKEEMKDLLPNRPVRSNKGSFGKVLAVGGSLGMAGAISLTSMAAYKVGCGTVTTIVPKSIIEIMQQKLTEVMTIGLEDEEGRFGIEAANNIKAILPKYDVIAIGPGIGRDKAIKLLLTEVLMSPLPCVIDADALYFLPELLELLKVRKASTIVTPHPGEMARLVGVSIEEILNEPLKYAAHFATTFHAITVLKLEKTVIADSNGVIYINRYGNSGLAKGGSGDTLTGIIAGLLAQHMTSIDAAKLGVYLQTRSADLAKEALSEYGYLASDVIRYLSRVFLELT